jgi:hypothetical protein
MISMQRKTPVLAVLLAVIILAPVARCMNMQEQEKQEPSADSAKARKVGTVKSLSGKSITIKVDSGPDVVVALQDSTRILRATPGQKDLSAATPIQPQDLQVGDRMLVRGSGEAGKDFVADLVIVMKRADIADKRQHERQDWQQRGLGGIVSAVDGTSGVITVSVMPSYSVTIKTSKETGFLRYAADSIKFSDAKHGSFDQIKVGDQLRARGSRSPDGRELTAEEVVSGTFRNIAGTVISVDAEANTVTVSDLLVKKPVVIHITKDSQMRKLSPSMAQGLVSLLRVNTSASPSPAGTPAADAPAGQPPAQSSASPAPPQNGGPPDLQRLLARVPTATLADLPKGEAVMIVSTEGTGKENAPLTAITLVSGVEPVLRASQNGSGAAAILSRWNLSSALTDQ